MTYSFELPQLSPGAACVRGPLRPLFFLPRCRRPPPRVPLRFRACAMEGARRRAPRDPTPPGPPRGALRGSWVGRGHRAQTRQRDAAEDLGRYPSVRPTSAVARPQPASRDVENCQGREGAEERCQHAVETELLPRPSAAATAPNAPTSMSMTMRSFVSLPASTLYAQPRSAPNNSERAMANATAPRLQLRDAESGRKFQVPRTLRSAWPSSPSRNRTKRSRNDGNPQLAPGVSWRWVESLPTLPRASGSLSRTSQGST